MRSLRGVELLLVATALVLHALSLTVYAQQPVLIEEATVVDVRSETQRPHHAILIEGGRIVAVGPLSTIHVPETARRVYAKGHWVIPGIIEAHSHDADPSRLARGLALGITTALTMPAGGDTLLHLQEWSQSATSETPRLHLVPWMFSAEFPDNLFPGHFPLLKPRTTEQARRYVERAHAAGTGQIKVFLDDGALWFEPNALTPSLEPDVLLEVVRTAHHRGIRVYAHAWASALARLAIATGVDALIHPVADSVLPEQFWDNLRRRNMPWVSTFSVLVIFGDPAEYARRVLADSVLRAVLTPEEKERLARDTASGSCLADLVPVHCQHYEEYFETVRRNTRQASAHGVPLALGSDAPLGEGTHIELELLQEAGIAAGEALRAATWGSAVALGVSHERGSIEPGRLADLVILQADPLLDIRNTRRVELVIKGGEIFEPSVLLGPTPPTR